MTRTRRWRAGPIIAGAVLVCACAQTSGVRIAEPDVEIPDGVAVAARWGRSKMDSRSDAPDRGPVGDLLLGGRTGSRVPSCGPTGSIPRRIPAEALSRDKYIVEWAATVLLIKDD